MNLNDFLPNAKLATANHTNKNAGEQVVTPDEVYVVWYSKTLQNAKALLGTHVNDGMYYEATFNGNTGAMYFDAYKKVENKTFE